MGYYEPSWSKEEQTMVDLMKLAGYGVVPEINREYTRIVLIPHPPQTAVYKFTADTEYEAIRKAFSFWNKNNA
jgi:hypothetical protein